MNGTYQEHFGVLHIDECRSEMLQIVLGEFRRRHDEECYLRTHSRSLARSQNVPADKTGVQFSIEQADRNGGIDIG